MSSYGNQNTNQWLFKAKHLAENGQLFWKNLPLKSTRYQTWTFYSICLQEKTDQVWFIVVSYMVKAQINTNSCFLSIRLFEQHRCLQRNLPYKCSYWNDIIKTYSTRWNRISQIILQSNLWYSVTKSGDELILRQNKTE